MMWNFSKYSENIAARQEDGLEISYRQLEERGKLLSEKIGGRTLVFCLCTNKVGSLLGYTSCLNNNIVTLLISEDMEEGLLNKIIEDYSPEFLWMQDEKVSEFNKYEKVYSDLGFTLLKTGFEEKYEINKELGLLLTTSGSTGSPKLVRQSYKNVLSNAESIVEYLELDETERPITTLPMNYTYGLSIINSHLLVGATILMTNSTLMDKSFWTYFKENKATSFGGVPYTYEILNKLRFFRMELPSLRTMTQAGGKLSPELHKKFAEFAKENAKKFVVMYGQTEATARMAYLPHEKSLEKYGSMGWAIPGGKFILIDTEGKEIKEPGITGELVYYGPNVTLGYAESGCDLILGDDNKGELVTGDMAKIDEEGFYYIVGRKKRFLKIFGNRVNLDESERMLKTEFMDVDFACTGVDDKMYIFTTDSEKESEAKVFISHKTGLNPSAFKIITINEIPKNDSGKTQYIKLEKYYA